MNINVFLEGDLPLTVNRGRHAYVSRYLVLIFLKVIKNYEFFIWFLQFLYSSLTVFLPLYEYRAFNRFYWVEAGCRLTREAQGSIP